MRILSPITGRDDTEAVIEAGAQELYCGLLPKDWPYTAFSINRRQNSKAQFGTFEDLSICASIAHAKDVPLFLTLNEHYYTHKQYPYILDYVARAQEAGVDAFIISDIALLLTLREMKIDIPLHISTGGATFNSACARFYENLGAERIILPRYLTVEEISRIKAEAPDIPFEVFILNSKCHNVDGLCMSHHGLAEVVDQDKAKRYRNLCMIPFDVHLSSPSLTEEELAAVAPKISKDRQLHWQRHHIDKRPCGACALYDFVKFGIYGVKIVGRENITDKKVIDITFIRECIDYLKEQKPEREKYIERTKRLYQRTYGYPCRSYMCYYPTNN